jgi:dihydroorotase
MKITLTKPDDWHIHLRDGDFLNTTAVHAAARFERAIIMPNLQPAIKGVAQAERYQQAILAALPRGSTFKPLMTLYLTDTTSIDTIVAAKASGIIFGCKLYPAGSTTHSDSGVSNLQNLYPVFEKMAELNLPLLIHGEVTREDIDIFDREARFLDTTLSSIIKQFPHLRIVLEHITTTEAVQYIATATTNIAATITAHHLLMNRNDLLAGGIKPHHYCLPVLKRRQHQEALLKAATSGNPRFFLGTDSAPHPKEQKESQCGCAGIYSAHAAIELYCEVFEQLHALEKLQPFASFYGADFYQLPRNETTITLIKEDWQVPKYYRYGATTLIPYRAGETIHWKLLTS